MNLESPKVNSSKSQEELYYFLGDVDNYKSLMPASLEKFEKINDTAFLFQLKGMPEILLEFKEKQPDHKIILGARSEKLPFTLTANIEEVESGSTAQLEFEGEFNAMMAMMIKSPIKKFIAALSENIGKL